MIFWDLGKKYGALRGQTPSRKLRTHIHLLKACEAAQGNIGFLERINRVVVVGALKSIFSD